MKRLCMLLAILLITSYEQDDSVIREEVDGKSSEVSLLNNRLLFDSKEDLKNFIETNKDVELDKKVGKLY